jgi:hypothetical protein
MSAAERVRVHHAAAVRAALPDRAARLAAQAAHLFHAGSSAGAPPPADVEVAAQRLAAWAAQLATERAWATFATLNPTAPGARTSRPGARRRRLVAAEQAASLGRRAVAALTAENQAARSGASGAVVGRARLAKQRRYDLVRQAGPPAWQAPSAARAAPAAPAAGGAEGGRWWARAACRDLDPELFTAATTPRPGAPGQASLRPLPGPARVPGRGARSLHAPVQAHAVRRRRDRRHHPGRAGPPPRPRSAGRGAWCRLTSPRSGRQRRLAARDSP